MLKRVEFPAPESLGPITEADFDAIFDGIQPGDYFSDTSPAAEQEQLALNMAVARTAITSLCEVADLADGMTIEHFTIDYRKASPRRAFGINSDGWHSDNQRPTRLTIVVADTLPTEFLTGKVPSKMSMRMHAYRDTGYGANKSYYLKVADVLKPRSDSELEDAGLQITHAKRPLEAIAFGARHIHRAPTNPTLESVARRFFRAHVQLQTPWTNA